MNIEIADAPKGRLLRLTSEQREDEKRLRKSKRKQTVETLPTPRKLHVEKPLKRNEKYDGWKSTYLTVIKQFMENVRKIKYQDGNHKGETENYYITFEDIIASVNDGKIDIDVEDLLYSLNQEFEFMYGDTEPELIDDFETDPSEFVDLLDDETVEKLVSIDFLFGNEENTEYVTVTFVDGVVSVVYQGDDKLDIVKPQNAAELKQYLTTIKGKQPEKAPKTVTPKTISGTTVKYEGWKSTYLSIIKQFMEHVRKIKYQNINYLNEVDRHYVTFENVHARINESMVGNNLEFLKYSLKEEMKCSYDNPEPQLTDDFRTNPSEFVDLLDDNTAEKLTSIDLLFGSEENAEYVTITFVDETVSIVYQGYGTFDIVKPQNAAQLKQYLTTIKGE